MSKKTATVNKPTRENGNHVAVLKENGQVVRVVSSQNAAEVKEVARKWKRGEYGLIVG